MKKLFFVIFLMGYPVNAQDIDDAAMLDDLRVCYDVADSVGNKTACIGALSELCMAVTEGGYSTLGMTSCALAEARAWDVLLNEELKLTLATFKRWDDEDQELFPEFSTREETFLTAQNAWIAYRHAECGNAYALWGSGAMRHISSATCKMKETAERVIEIWAKRKPY